MEAFVLDVSACIPWCCEDETTQASDQLLEWAIEGSTLHVPSLWTWEILNTLATVIKRRRISADRGEAFLAQLASFRFRIDRAPQVAEFPRLHALAAMHQLTAYDAAYLDLAKRLALPLATLDTDLRKAAHAESVRVL